MGAFRLVRTSSPRHDHPRLKRDRLRLLVVVCYGMKPPPILPGRPDFRCIWSWSVTEIPLKSWCNSDQKAIHEQLDRILGSGPFAQSQRRQRFLEYLVNETLAGRGERLKGYTIAVEVFERPATFDPNIDPLVRIEAGRLRDKLREYYGADGKTDPIRIDLPKGSYAPDIEFRQAATAEPKPEGTDATAPDRPLDITPTTAALIDERPPLEPSWPPSGVRWQIVALASAVILLVAFGAWRWSSGSSTQQRQITKTDFRLCSTCLSHS